VTNPVCSPLTLSMGTGNRVHNLGGMCIPVHPRLSRGITSACLDFHPRQSRITATPGSLGATCGGPPSGRVSTLPMTPPSQPAHPPLRKPSRRAQFMPTLRVKSDDHAVRVLAPPTPVIFVRAPCVPVPAGTHGEPWTTTVKVSLSVHHNAFLLTDGHGPLLCTAGVEGSSPFVSTTGDLGER
jgi:hypothetical protein